MVVDALIDQQPEPEWLLHLSVLRLEPGDVVVVRSPYKMTIDSVERLRTQIARVIGQNHRVMVLENDMDIGVIRGA